MIFLTFVLIVLGQFALGAGVGLIVFMGTDYFLNACKKLRDRKKSFADAAKSNIPYPTNLP